jgi:DNA-binding CsgD family transcriptional regulator
MSGEEEVVATVEGKQTSLRMFAAGLIPSPVIRFAGFSFIQCWIIALFASPCFVGSFDSYTAQGMHWFSTVGSVVCAFSLLLTATRLIPLSRHKAINFLMGFLSMAGGLLAVLGSQGIIPSYASYAGFFVAGVGTAWACLCWQEYVSTQGAGKALGALLLSTISGGALYLVICLLPFRAACVCFLVLPVLSAISLQPARGTRFYHSKHAFSGTKALFSDIATDVSPRLMAVCCFVSCSYGCLRVHQAIAGAAEPSTLALPVASICVASILSCAVVIVTRGAGLARSVIIGVVLCAVGAAMLASDDLLNSGIPGALALCGSNVVYYTIWLLLLERSMVRRLPILGLLASLWMANYLGIFVGQVIGRLVGANAGDAIGYLSMAFLLAAALVLVAAGGNQHTALSEETLNGPTVTEQDAKVSAVAARFGLSDRETEIMRLWLTGHTAAYLEEKLFISRNTVKTHIRHIYRKAGVSDRESLLRLVESEKASGK